MSILFLLFFLFYMNLNKVRNVEIKEILGVGVCVFVLLTKNPG